MRADGDVGPRAGGPPHSGLRNEEVSLNKLHPFCFIHKFSTQA